MKNKYIIFLMVALFVLLVSANVSAESIDDEMFVDTNIFENSLSVQTTSSADYQGYRDVFMSDWYYGVVRDVTMRLIMQGSGGYFYPESNINRAEATAIIARAYGENAVAARDCAFTDVSLNHWARTYIAWAHEKGIVNGVSEHYFEPDSNVRRQDFAVIVLRYLQNTENFTPAPIRSKVTYADDANISSYAKDAVYILQRAGILSVDTKFYPQNYLRRSEAAKILSTTMSLLRESGKTVSDTEEEFVRKFNNIYISGYVTSTLSQTYRRSSPWLTLYDSSLTVLYPKSFSDAYSVEVLVSNTFYLQFNQNTLIERSYNYTPDILYNTSIHNGGSRGAMNSFKGYYGSGTPYAAIRASTYLAMIADEGLAGLTATAHSTPLE